VDIERDPPPKKRRWIVGGAILLGVVTITAAVSRLEPAAPGVELATLMIDSVRSGTLVREVRAPGRLVPERVRIIAAVTAGRVEQLPIRPGTVVTPTTLVAELTNPDVQLQSLESQRSLTAAEGQLVSQGTTLETQRLAQEGTLATLRSQLSDARRQLTVMEALDAKGLASASELASARDRVRELTTRESGERRRLELMAGSVDRELALQRAQVERLRAISHFQDDRVRSMRVLAGESGVLLELPLELGQWVNPGMVLARVAQPGQLKAVLQVPETQARDVVVGQPASIDTRNGVARGRVMRVDPGAQNGTVTVEVSLEGELPRGARADLTVDGTIEIERLPNVLYVGRPAYGQAETTVPLFRVDADGRTATKVDVRFGRASVNTIQVVQGLRPGDRVIVSDMSAHDEATRVRLR
jgi:multidrug resistance efflux pump